MEATRSEVGAWCWAYYTSGGRGFCLPFEGTAMKKSKGNEAASLWKDVRQYALSVWQTTLSPGGIPYEQPYSWEDPRMKLVPPVLHPRFAKPAAGDTDACT